MISTDQLNSAVRSATKTAFARVMSSRWPRCGHMTRYAVAYVEVCRLCWQSSNKSPHGLIGPVFKTLSTAVDSWNGRLMIIMFCILKHSTLAKNSRQGWDLFIGMIPILQELQVLILFIPVVFFEHLELQRWPGQRSCRRTEFDSAALTGKQFKHICGTPVRDALKRCPRLHCLSDTIRYYQILSSLKSLWMKCQHQDS